ncbi:MAG: VWA domain-containing protein [Deltaproteobacteria bacterium]|nr:VWA domain-containing protein [Deltaproteobacteria bacterium]
MDYGAWAFIGLFAFAFVGFLLYYRELSEIKEAARVIDEAENRDHDILQRLTVLARALLGPHVMLVQGNAVSVLSGDGPVQMAGLPVRESRDIPEDQRLEWHRFQLAVVHAWNETGRLPPDDLRNRRIDHYLQEELPGIFSLRERLMRFENKERRLYPALELMIVPVEDRPAVPAEAPPPPSGDTGDGKEPASLFRRGKRVDPKSQKQGLNLNIGSQFEFGTRAYGTTLRKDEENEAHPSEAGDAPLSPMADPDSTSAGKTVAAGNSRPEAGGSLSGKVFLYDEWDASTTSYRQKYCAVTESAAGVDAPSSGWAERMAAHRATQREIERILLSLMPLPRKLTREPYGDDVDLDAYVRSRCDLIAGRTPDDRIYERKVLRERSVSVALLIDWSASTERWVGRCRAFELGQESAAMFASALGKLGDPFSIYGFSGQGRDNVRVGRLKSFGEPWSPELVERFGAVGPGRFTRIGAAIRHAAAQIRPQRTAQRLLLVFSDGRPQDDDGYDGAYAVADVRQAVREARRNGVRPFCLALGDEARNHLPAMFGRDWAVHDDPGTLPERLAKIYVTLTCTA